MAEQGDQGEDQKVVTLAQAHQAWLTENATTRWDRFRGSWLFPPRDASTANKVLGWLWRFLLILTVALIGFEYIVRKHLRSPAFAGLIADELETVLPAEEVNCSSLRWKNRQAAIGVVEATGSDESFFHHLRAQEVRFTIPWSMTFEEAWSIEDFSILDLQIDLEKIGPLPVPDEPAEPGEGPGTGIGLCPSLDQLAFEALNVTNASFRWGGAPGSPAHGRLENARMTLIRNGDGIAINLSSGKLTQHWLENLELVRLNVRHSPGLITLEDGNLKFGDGGTGTFSGTVATGGDQPEIKVQASLTGVDLERVLPPELAAHVSGSVNLEFEVARTGEGAVSRGTITLNEILVRNINALETLTTIYADPRFRRLRLTGGTLEFVTRDGATQFTSIDLESGEFARLTGEFQLQKPDRLFDGALELGVRPEALGRFPEVGDRHFPRDESGFRWTSLDLKGVIGEVTKGRSDKLANEIRELRRAGKL